MTQREYVLLVFGSSWTTRLQTVLGLIVFMVLVLISLNDPSWGGPWDH